MMLINDFCILHSDIDISLRRTSRSSSAVIDNSRAGLGKETHLKIDHGRVVATRMETTIQGIFELAHNNIFAEEDQNAKQA